MSSIADRIIESSNGMGSSNDMAPHGYYVDDLGYYVENNLKESKERLARYLLTRIMTIHPNVHRHGASIFCGDKEIKLSTKSITALYDCPRYTINEAQAAWIFNRLSELAPELSNRYIIVGKGIVWDNLECELKPMNDNMLSIKDDYDPRKKLQEELSS